MTTDAKQAPTGPITPIDGWLRSQQETLPLLDKECEEKLATLDKQGEAIRAAWETVKRTAAAIGVQLPSQKNGKNAPKPPTPAPEAS